MVQATENRYVVRNDRILGGEPIIKETRTPVRAIIETWRMGATPEEILTGMPHLTLARVFDALSYYCDHQDEIDDYIERNKIPEELIHPLLKNS
ncbi:MAG: DUF433 domain-containing protein [Cyanobacteriota bacterium]|nr:DUF433 domain-containing protein [Cyanobacteriota bacterium]